MSNVCIHHKDEQLALYSIFNSFQKFNFTTFIVTSSFTVTVTTIYDLIGLACLSTIYHQQSHRCTQCRVKQYADKQTDICCSICCSNLISPTRKYFICLSSPLNNDKLKGSIIVGIQMTCPTRHPVVHHGGGYGGQDVTSCVTN